MTCVFGLSCLHGVGDETNGMVVAIALLAIDLRALRLSEFLVKSARSKKVPKGYFDVLYLDDDLRIHKTGEDNMFVQARESWSSAAPLLA